MKIYQKVTKKVVYKGKNINEQINSRFTPASDLKNWKHLFFNTQFLILKKGISKKVTTPS